MSTLPLLASRHLRAKQDLDKQVEWEQEVTVTVQKQRDFLDRFKLPGKKPDSRAKKAATGAAVQGHHAAKNVIGLADQKVASNRV